LVLEAIEAAVRHIGKALLLTPHVPADDPIRLQPAVVVDAVHRDVYRIPDWEEEERVYSGNTVVIFQPKRG